MANGTRSGCKISFSNDTQSAKRRHVGGKGSTISGSATTDTSGLIRSTRETSSRNQNLSSTSSTQKSERLEKRAPANPLIKRKIEQVEKQRMLSPSKKSEGSKEHRSSASSGSKKFEKGLSCPYTESKNENREKNGKKEMMDARERRKDEQQQPKSSCVILKKKSLDARSYRALLSAPARISKWSAEKRINSLRGTDMDSDTSPMEASKEIRSVTVDAVSSSPSGSEMGNFIERCIVCSKKQRVDFDSHDQEFCHCNAKKSVALDANYYKVCLNKMLAKALRSKFSDQGASGAQGQQQGMPTSFMQQLFQMSLHQHSQRPAAVYNTPPSAPPLQVVHHSSAFFSSNSARQHISPVPPAGNFQVCGEPRAPALRLQCFRSSTFMSVPNLQPVPHTIPSQLAISNAASTSSMIPRLASRAPTYLSGPFSWGQLLESAGGLVGFSKRPLSALQLPFNVGNQPCVNPAGLLLPLPDLGPTLDVLDPFKLITHGSLQGTAARTSPEGRVHF